MTKEEKINQELSVDLDGFMEDLRRYEIVYTQGDVDNGAVPVGQTCGLIDSIMDVGDIITSFSNEAEKILKKLCANIA